MSFSTSSSFSSTRRDCCEASFSTVDESVPGSEVDEICFADGDVKPRKGREKYFKNVVSNGSEASVGSFESLHYAHKLC